MKASVTLLENKDSNPSTMILPGKWTQKLQSGSLKQANKKELPWTIKWPNIFNSYSRETPWWFMMVIQNRMTDPQSFSKTSKALTGTQLDSKPHPQKHLTFLGGQNLGPSKSNKLNVTTRTLYFLPPNQLPYSTKIC